MADYTFPVGAKRTIDRDLRSRTWTNSAWADWADTTLSSATVFVIDAERDTAGEADSASASTVVDATRDEADSFWVGVTLEFTSGECAGERREVSAFTSSTGTITLDVTNAPLPATPEAGDDFLLRGYPIVPVTDLDGHDHGDVTTATVQFQVRPDDGASSTNGVTATPGRKVIIIQATWTYGSYTEVERFAYSIDVTPST